MLKIYAVRDSRISFSSISDIDNVLLYSADGVSYNNLTQDEVLMLPKGYTLEIMSEDMTGSRFSIVGGVNISGDLLDLFKCNKVSFFARSLFEGCDIIDASLLLMPKEFFKEDCFREMFKNSSVNYIPELPAMVLTDGCYQDMFRNCKIFNDNVILPAEELRESCYRGMFANATISNHPTINALYMQQMSCYEMFDGAYFIENSFVSLSCEHLAKHCYSGMYKNSNISGYVFLPARKMEEGCYQDMFRGCSFLNAAPIVNANDTAKDCFSFMFAFSGVKNVAQLNNIKKVVSGSFSNMYIGCTDLDCKGAIPKARLMDGSCNNMFMNSTLKNYPDIDLPYAEKNCFDNMFSGVVVKDNDMVFSINRTNDLHFNGMFRNVNKKDIGSGFYKFINEWR